MFGEDTVHHGGGRHGSRGSRHLWQLKHEGACSPLSRSGSRDGLGLGTGYTSQAPPLSDPLPLAKSHFREFLQHPWASSTISSRTWMSSWVHSDSNTDQQLPPITTVHRWYLFIRPFISLTHWAALDDTHRKWEKSVSAPGPLLEQQWTVSTSLTLLPCAPTLVSAFWTSSKMAEDR